MSSGMQHTATHFTWLNQDMSSGMQHTATHFTWLNQDMSSGIDPACYSLAHFLKYHFTHILSLENIQQGDFYKSKLDGKSSALNAQPSFSCL